MDNLDEGASLGKRITQGANLGRQAARNFMRDATPGQKIAAATTAAGAAYHGARRGRRAWKRDDKRNRASRTAKEAAKGAFGGAIGGAITGYGVGKAVDYLGGYERKTRSQGASKDSSRDKPKKYWRGRPMDDIAAAIHNLLTDSTVREVVESLLEAKGPRELVFGPRLGQFKALGVMALGVKGAQPARSRGFIADYFRKRRVKKYREQLWRKHQHEIYRESKKAKDAVMRHSKALTEYIAGMRNNVVSVYDAPEAPVRDLTAVLSKDKSKIFVNSSEPGSSWSRDRMSEYARWCIMYSAQLAAHYGQSFGYTVGLLIAIAYEDYVYNKYEKDKSLYTY